MAYEAMNNAGFDVANSYSRRGRPSAQQASRQLLSANPNPVGLAKQDSGLLINIANPAALQLLQLLSDLSGYTHMRLARWFGIHVMLLPEQRRPSGG